MRNKVIVIAGPTAVGKTKIAIELAKKIDSEIISADSMQVYKHMDIGTAKPSKKEMQGIKHYMIDIIEPDEEFSVARYKKMALECIAKVINKGKVPIVVGGTGLYINSLSENIEFSETITDWDYRIYLQERAQKSGTGVLYEELRQIDPESSERIHPNDLRRIIRAMEVYKSTGKPMSYHIKVSKEKPSMYDFIKIGLNTDRDELYNRINQRVDKMLENGLEDEVRGLINKGIDIKSTAMQGLGYKETVELCKGLKSLEEIMNTIKQNTRRYAKRQLTWFRRDKEIYWIDSRNGEEEILKKIFICLEENGMFM